MDKALKGLIAAACVAVIVVTGYWGWSQFATTQAGTDDAAFATNRDRCLGVLRDLNMGAYKVRPAQQKCIADGYVTLADEQAAEKRYVGGTAQ